MEWGCASPESEEMPVSGTAAVTQTCSASRPCEATTIPAEIKARTVSTDANPLFHRERFAPATPQPARVSGSPISPAPSRASFRGAAKRVPQPGPLAAALPAWGQRQPESSERSIGPGAGRAGPGSPKYP